MLYRYNYSYLPEWMEANAPLPVNTILQAIGSKSNNSLRSWEQKLCAMPIVTLLRFCNSFQIPIEAFICNTGDPFKDKVYIPTSAQFEPDGGYTTDPALRQPGERKPLDPTNVKIVPSILPNVIAFTSSKEEQTEAAPITDAGTIAKNETGDGELRKQMSAQNYFRLLHFSNNTPQTKLSILNNNKPCSTSSKRNKHKLKH